MNNFAVTTFKYDLCVLATFSLLACIPPTEPLGPIQSGGKSIVSGTDVAPSPDGRMIAFLRDGLLFIADTSGANVIQLSPMGHLLSPRWSSDGTKIGFIRQDTVSWYFHKIFLFDLQTKTARALVGADTVFTLSGSRFDWQWSPDGQFIAFLSTDQSQRMLKVVRVSDGSVSNRLPAREFSWSPTSAQLVCTAPGPTDSTIIGLVNIGNNILTPIVTGKPANLLGWLPTTSKIVFYSSSTGLVVYDLDNGMQTPIYISPLQWDLAPNGLKIAYVQQTYPFNPDEGSQFDLYCYGLSTNTVTLLIHGNAFITARWSPRSDYVYYIFSDSIYKTGAP